MRAGIQCPVDGACITDEACLACRVGKPRPASGEKCDFAYEQLKGMMDGSGRENAGISATMLGGVCPRQTWLKARYPWYLNPEKGYQAFRGTMSHLMMELYPEPGSLCEHRFEVEIDGRIITGRIDKIHPGQKTITDFKSKAEDKDPPLTIDKSYAYQLNVYRYLCFHGSPQQDITHDATGSLLDAPILAGSPAGIEIDRLYLNYWTFGWVKMLEVPLMTDKKIIKYITSGSYEQQLEAPPPVPRSLDPAGYRGKPSVFCTEWCPVREACLTRLIEGE